MQWLFSFHQHPIFSQIFAGLAACCPARSLRTGGNAACTNSAKISAPSPLRPSGAKGRAVFAQQKHRSLTERSPFRVRERDAEGSPFNLRGWGLRGAAPPDLPVQVAAPTVRSLPPERPLRWHFIKQTYCDLSFIFFLNIFKKK